ncbi:MAG: hypothetical protein ACOWWO_13500 [Peptococcaceae bacterium]
MTSNVWNTKKYDRQNSANVKAKVHKQQESWPFSRYKENIKNDVLVQILAEVKKLNERVGRLEELLGKQHEQI